MKARLLASVALLGGLAGCGGGSESTVSAIHGGNSGVLAVAAAGSQPLDLSPPRVDIGGRIFEDVSLSASGRMACATCHIAARAHTDAAGGFLPLGGPNLDQQGLRSTPTTHYLFANSAFRFENGQPFGGFTWDGRADSLAEQAGGPFSEAVEMANADLPDLMAKVRRADWFPEFLGVYGLKSADSNETLFEQIKIALATYQLGDGDYHLFNSKYDRSLEGVDTLNDQELRGLALFNDPAKGNCAACHTSARQADGGKPLLSNFGYYALGVPRNQSTRTTSDASFFDLGLCGPNRKNLAERDDLCGKFKTPTLRNIELTAPYFHNAAISTLEDAVRFHITRDTDAARWYPTANGVAQKFNDLPARYQGNVVRTAPFDRAAGDLPALNESEIADLVAFLGTLTDTIPPPAP